jgi:Methyltransferase domain
MPIVAAIIGQFAKPTGIFGRLVGFILANRSSNVRRGRWTVDLLELSSRDWVLEVGLRSKACLKRLEQGTAAGLDHPEVMIDQARRRNARAVEMKRLRLIVGTIDDLLADEWFDRIYSINLIQFIPDEPAFYWGLTLPPGSARGCPVTVRNDSDLVSRQSGRAAGAA